MVRAIGQRSFYKQCRRSLTLLCPTEAHDT